LYVSFGPRSKVTGMPAATVALPRIRVPPAAGIEIEEILVEALR
jgi:hypothetical protein